MARERGTFNFSASLEVKKQAPKKVGDKITIFPSVEGKTEGLEYKYVWKDLENSSSNLIRRSRRIICCVRQYRQQKRQILLYLQ